MRSYIAKPISILGFLEYGRIIPATISPLAYTAPLFPESPNNDDGRSAFCAKFPHAVLNAVNKLSQEDGIPGGRDWSVVV